MFLQSNHSLSYTWAHGCSYEDNEVRAISAAKEIIRAFEGLNLAASIGITTGQVGDEG